MNSWQDYLLFPPQPAIDWTAAALTSTQYKSVIETVAPGMSAAGDTPLQVRVTQIVPQSHYYDYGVNQGSRSQLAGSSQTAESAKSLSTYARALQSGNASAATQSGGCSGIKERLACQQNFVRIQNALRRGTWVPDDRHLPANALTWNIARQMDSYRGNLQAELTSVHEPLERCLRVVVYIATLAQKYDCQDNNTALSCLQVCFGTLFRETFRPCLAAIKAQVATGYARDYFEVFHFILNFFPYHPDSSLSERGGIRSEISAALSSMVEIELDYRQYSLSFPRRGENTWFTRDLKRLLGAGNLFRRLQLVSDQQAQAYLQKLQALECTLQDPGPANPDSFHKIDLLIAEGSLKAASDLLAAGDGGHPFQERLMYEILKHECAKAVVSYQPVVSLEQELAQLIGLNLFARTYRSFISSHFFLFHHVRMLLSDLVARLLTCHKLKISHHEKRREVERAVKELANNNVLSDQCLSLWWMYQRSVLPIEDSLAGMTSRDGFALCKAISKQLSGKTATDTDYQQAAQAIRCWVINENMLPTMNHGLWLVRDLRELKHKLYLHFFQEIFLDGFVKNKNGSVDYRRVIEVMDQHRSGCLKNQDVLFLLRDEHHHRHWQQIACQAWGKLICDLREKIVHGRVISEMELDDVLSLRTVSPFVEHELTNADLKRLVVNVFKTAVHQPDIIQVSYYKLECLAHWVLAILCVNPPSSLESAWHNNVIRKTISAYFDFVHQGRGVVVRPPPGLPAPSGKVVLTPDDWSEPREIPLCTTDVGRWQPIAPYAESDGGLNQPMDSYETLLLNCMPVPIIIKNDYSRLHHSLRQISAVLHDILSRGVTDYEAITKKELDRIDLCLANLAPWFRQFCSQEEVGKFSRVLADLTKLNSNGSKIHPAFSGLIINRIRQGDISGAVNIICVQQALYRVRAALGLPLIG